MLPKLCLALTFGLVAIASQPASAQESPGAFLTGLHLLESQPDASGEVFYHMALDGPEFRVLRERNLFVEREKAAVWQGPGPGTVPLYRYRSRRTNDHFFTMSLDEGNKAVSKYDYIPEGVCCYVYAAPGQSPYPNLPAIPLYRLQFKNAHFYTINPDTRAHRLLDGWEDEGIAGYVLMLPKN